MIKRKPNNITGSPLQSIPVNVSPPKKSNLLPALIYGPGTFILYVGYIFPKEWGKKRNTTGTGRRWNERHVLAPIYSAIFYLVIIGLVALYFGSRFHHR